MAQVAACPLLAALHSIQIQQTDILGYGFVSGGLRNSLASFARSAFTMDCFAKLSTFVSAIARARGEAPDLLARFGFAP